MRLSITACVACLIVCGSARSQISDEVANESDDTPSATAQMISAYLHNRIRPDMGHAHMIDTELAAVRALYAESMPFVANLGFRTSCIWSQLILLLDHASSLDAVVGDLRDEFGVEVVAHEEFMSKYDILTFAGVVNPIALKPAVESLPHVNSVSINWIGRTPEGTGHSGLFVLEEGGLRTYVFTSVHGHAEGKPAYTESACYQARAGELEFAGNWDSSEGEDSPRWWSLVEKAWGLADLR